MNKLIVATMLMMGAAAFAAEQAPQAPAADPMVSALNNLVETLAGGASDAAVAGNSAKAGRSKKDTAVAIGTAAAIGSAIGAMIAKEDRAKGAAIGAAVGGIAGLIYDRMHANDAPKAAETPAPEKKIL